MGTPNTGNASVALLSGIGALFIKNLTADPNHVAHWGVKGMKWGVRRSRSALAAAGGSGSGGEGGGGGGGAGGADGAKRPSSTRRTRYASGPKNLTDAQLKERTQRLEAEKRYNDLNARYVSEGERLIRSVLSDSGKQVATKLIVGGVTYYLKKQVQTRKGEEIAKEIFGKKK